MGEEENNNFPGPCVHTQTKRLEEALGHLRSLMSWAPDDLPAMPSEWKDAASFLQRQGVDSKS